MKAILIVLALLAATPAAAAPAAADTVAAPAPGEAWRLRGTETPLTAHPTAGQRLGKTLGYVPYGLVELTGRPVWWLIRLEETRHPVRRLTRLLTWDVAPADTRVQARFGYESGLGLTLVGLHASSSDWFGTGVDYGLTLGYLNPRNALVELELEGREGVAWLSWLTRFERKDNRPFYGLGPAAPDARSDYHRQFLLNELALHLAPAGNWRLSAAVYQRHTDLDEPDEGLEDIGSDDRPTTNAEHPGLYRQAEVARYEGVELALTYDARAPDGFIPRGWFVQLVGGANFASSADDADYRHYSVEVKTCAEVWRGRGFAARVYAEGLDADRFDRIPFTELPALGGRHTLRGFDSERYRDLRAAVATLEYRWPVAAWLQGRLFWDWGMVAPAWSEMQFEALEVSGGLALAVRLGESALTVQYARSEEGGHLYLGTGVAFGQDPRRRR